MDFSNSTFLRTVFFVPLLQLRMLSMWCGWTGLRKIRNIFGRIYGFDLIQMSRVSLSYNPNMLIFSMCFWDTSTNTFHLPCGMLTPALFDIATILGLQPTGMNFEPSRKTSTNNSFNISRTTYNSFMEYHKESSDRIYEHEHTAFLAYWLSRYVFYAQSVQV